MRTGDQARSLGEITVGGGTGRGERGFSNHSFPLGLPICCDDILAVEVSLVDPEGVVIAGKKGVVLN